MSSINYKTIEVDGLDIFYREAGNKKNPAILLLHGFPSSSHMYRDLMNDLSDSYFLIAPDYPGFGQSSMPSPLTYNYSFDNLANTMNHFIDALDLEKFSLYVQDYGGPIGFRMAAQRPELIQALIIQNANAYNEGLGDALKPLVDYIENQNEETERAVRFFLSFEANKWLHTDGAEDILKISPDSYTLDQHYLDRPGNDQIQLALFRNYGSNLPLYNEWQSYFRTYQPHALIVSGKNDQLFVPAGQEAYKKDLKNAEINLLNGGHFVLEEKHTEIALLIKSFLMRKGFGNFVKLDELSAGKAEHEFSR